MTTALISNRSAAAKPPPRSDVYRLEPKSVLLNGRQALTQVAFLQRAIDRRDGRNTAGYITGYRGSPIGGFDDELWKIEELLRAENIVFEPGLNEDLALTAAAGTQQLDFVPDRKVDGVFALWYAKGPGVDRSGDAIKHANLAGTWPLGGLVLAFGDDHPGKSSTLAHQSDLTLASWEVPVLYPATVSEIVEFGVAAFAMSRFSGALVGLKLVNETAEGTGVFDFSDLPRFEWPDVADAPGGVHIRPEHRAMMDQDARLLHYKLPRAQAFARANRLDLIAFGAKQPRFLVATAGKAYVDTRAALKSLGIDQAVAERIGLGVYKIGLIYPLDRVGLSEAAARAEEILFVEEKRSHCESQARLLLYDGPVHPRITGKLGPNGEQLLSADKPIEALCVGSALAERLSAALPDIDVLHPDFRDAVARIRTLQGNAQGRMPLAVRRPAFCAGCPHNVSTKVPEGSFGATGIGCHGMAVFHPERNPLPMGHMGAEGASWIGLARFSGTKHLFQNLGDGTFSHSGSLAIRAAVAAKVNITYKILYNDAVAMTGGQPLEGGLTVTRIVAQVAAEGVTRVAVLSEYPDRFSGAEALPPGTELRHREDVGIVQEEMKDQPGVTVIIYDQVCAAEKRRRRKIGKYPDPDVRIFINTAVCEGCGDCSVQSNCLAIQPVETELGRKRRIDQSACNKDTTCATGFCPSFVILEGATPRAGTEIDDATPLPAPALPALDDGFDILIAGVGGTGVVTAAQIIGTAARIEGLGASLYDMTGLSQKGGAVYSHIRLTRDAAEIAPARVGAGESRLLLACDLVAAVQHEAASTIAAERTLVVANEDVAPTADFQVNRDHETPRDAMIAYLSGLSGDNVVLVPANSLAEALLGDSIGANVLMLGLAWQRGGIPISLQAIRRAIGLNGRAAEANLKAFEAGRRAALNPESIQSQPQTLDEFIARRIEDLSVYRNPAYADRYRQIMDRVAAACRRVTGSNAFAWGAARSAYNLMAYKDEYEVARLYSRPQYREALDRAFTGIRRVSLLLSPPILARVDPATGRPRKHAFGPWIFPFLRVLARFRFLRETPLDPFGASCERRLERAIRDGFLAKLETTATALSEANLAEATRFAEAPLAVRGFGPVKVAASKALLAALGGDPMAAWL